MLNTAAKSIKQKVKEFLESNCVGIDRALTAAQITYQLQLNDKRAFRAAVHELRAVDNMPILSSSSKGGYYLPASPAEVEAGLEEFTSRVISLRTAAKGIRAGLSLRFPDKQIQFALFDTEGIDKSGNEIRHSLPNYL
jgi:hypothetical protein